MVLIDFIAAWVDPLETGEDIDARAAVIAEAINQEYPPSKWPYGVPSWRALLLRTWFEEGARFSLAVHSGRKLGDDGRAACLGQVWSHGTLLPRVAWSATTGTDPDSTRACARATSRYLTVGVDRCLRSNLSQLENTARVVMLYGTGKRCTPGRWAYVRATGAIRWTEVFAQPNEDDHG